MSVIVALKVYVLVPEYAEGSAGSSIDAMDGGVLSRDVTLNDVEFAL